MKTVKKQASTTTNKTTIPSDVKTSTNSTTMKPNATKTTGGIKRRYILFIVVVAVLLGVTLGLVVKNRISDSSDVKEQIITSEDKDLLTAGLQSSTGIDYTVIVKNDITESTYNSFEQAYQTGLVLYANGEYQKALESFSIAEKLGPLDYVFYVDYAAVLDAVNKRAEAVEKLQKAKEIIQNDIELPDEEKSEQLRAVEDKINAA